MAALVLYWPRVRGEPARPALADGASACQLRGFRADADAFCVVGFRRESEGDAIGLLFGAEAELRAAEWRGLPPEFVIAVFDGAGAPVAALCTASEEAKRVELRRRRCSVVFYDAELAAGGVFALERLRLLAAPPSGAPATPQAQSLAVSPFFHAPALLDKIGHYNIQDAHLQRDAITRQGTIMAGVVAAAERIGAGASYAPFALLTALAVGVNAAVTRLRAPQWLPLIGGKALEDGSQFLALSSRRLAGVASWPKRVRHYYHLSKSRPLTYQEKLDALQLFDFVLMVVIDVAIGFFLSSFVASWMQSHSETPRTYEIVSAPVHFLRLLRTNVAWLMGAPAGFKLNRPLATILGNGVLLWLDMWEFFFSSMLSVVVGSIGLDATGRAAPDSSGSLLLAVLSVVWTIMGVSLQLSLLVDGLTVSTWSSRWVYQYFAKLNRLQRGLFSSLWRLFVGKKKNVLRQRVDSQEYDISQLLLGTLLFTILVFIATTTMVFFVFFLLVRAAVLSVLAVLKAPVIAVHTLPVATLIVRLCRPRFFTAGMRLEPLSTGEVARSNTAEVTIRSVEIGASPTDDRRHRHTIRDALAAIGDADRIGDATVTTSASVADATECAYFELKPIAVSPGGLLTRLRRYLAKPPAPPQTTDAPLKEPVKENAGLLSILCDLPPHSWSSVGVSEAGERPKLE